MSNVKKLASTLMEKYMGFKKTVAAIEKGGSAKDPEAVAAAVGRKKYGKAKFQKAAAAGKKLGEGSKPDFLDLDKDGNRKEPMKKAAKDAKMNEGAKHSSRPGTKQRPGSATQAEKAVARKKELKADLEKRRSENPSKGDKKVTEGKMKDLSMDLKELSEAEFKKKYGKTKAEMRKSLSEARELKDKEEFDNRAKIGDYYYTKTGNKVTKTAGGIKHERGYKKEKDEVDENIDWEKAKQEYLAKGGKITRGKYHKPRKSELPGGSRHIGGQREMSGGKAPGLSAPRTGSKVIGIKGVAEATVTEKAVSKAQQKFMGMVYAAKKGEKPASPAVANVAKGMTAKAAKDYAKTKHKGLPQHVKESRQMNESHDIRKHPIYTTQEAWDHYARELAEQEMNSIEASAVMDSADEDLDAELNEISKLAGLNTAVQENDHIHPNALEVDESPLITGKDFEDLDEVAKLAGLTPKAESTCMECGMYESDCGCDHEDMMEADVCPTCKSEPCACVESMAEGEEEMDEGNEFSGALAKARAEHKKEFEVDGKTYPVKESLSVNINATDEDVVVLMQKLAGMPVVAVATHDHTLEETDVKTRDIEYTNSPREQVAEPEAAYPGGTDLNRPKKSYSDKPFRGDNPMSVKEDALWKSYQSMIRDIKG